MPDSFPTADVRLPDSEVPELEFAGIKAQYAALKHVIALRLAAVFEHGRYIMGPEVEELEAALCDFSDARHAIAVSSGTDALLAPLMAWGIGPGDAVFLPAFTFTATPEVVALLGATPVFVDVDPRSFNLDAADLQRRFQDVKASGNLMPRAVIAVDLFGLPADYDSLGDFCATEGLHLLADAAQSFGATYRGRRVGTLAPVTAISFFPAKPLGCYGDGGAVLTDDGTIAAALRSIRVHGKGTDKYDIVRVGLNARLDTVQAAVLLAKLTVFEGELKARGVLADLYDANLPKGVVSPARIEDRRSAWAVYSILTERRDTLKAALDGAGIPSAVYYPKPLHLQSAYAGSGGGEGSLPVAESLCGRILSLPMHGYMADGAARRVVDAVGKAMEV